MSLQQQWVAAAAQQIQIAIDNEVLKAMGDDEDEISRDYAREKYEQKLRDATKEAFAFTFVGALGLALLLSIGRVLYELYRKGPETVLVAGGCVAAFCTVAMGVRWFLIRRAQLDYARRLMTGG